MKIVSVIGARPQFVKAATVSRIVAATDGLREVLLHTGQHYDDNMSQVFFDELSIPQPNYNLDIGSGSHGAQTGAMLRDIESVLVSESPDGVLIYGDTNSTLAAALAAVKLHIPVAHVEAGLRSFNRRMPEEINRVVADRISDILFAPTQTAVMHLEREGLKDNTVLSGDVMYDSILYYRHQLDADPDSHRLPDMPERYYLATVHRPQNTDNPDALSAIFAAFAALPCPVVLPLHPRTARYIAEYGIEPRNVRLIEPIGYLWMLRLLLDCEKALTDSGGLQKEAYLLGKPCVTLRTETEWVETVHDGWNEVVAADRERIEQAAAAPMPTAPRRNAFGDGHAADIIVNSLLNRL
ncbi:MAG: UDP-N-acetylglucosamine 2-epimerase (non-hydrolyzing) [Candidatus Cloacimonetes bacterium]|nr:UDP-N-acetylglucosamine 2-epimerase (non-hydrolyzing) [Candidatus Cloacimonadota bacterium]